MILMEAIALLLAVWAATAFSFVSMWLRNDRWKQVSEEVSIGFVVLSIVIFFFLIRSLIMR